MNRAKNDAPKLEREEKRHGGAPAPKRERRGGRRWLFLVVDALLLAAIVTAVIFLISLLTPWSIFEGGQGELRSLTYTVEIAGVDGEQLTALQRGDTVTDCKTGAVIGTVTAINNRDYEVYADTPIEKTEGDSKYYDPEVFLRKFQQPDSPKAFPKHPLRIPGGHPLQKF